MAQAIRYDELGQNMLNHLLELKADKSGSATVTECADKIITKVITGLEATAPKSDELVQKEIRDILRLLRETKEEISRASNAAISKDKIFDANISLDEVIKETEEATNSIMDNVDSIFEVSANMPAAIADRLNAAGIKIMEACNFQDLTGQRIRKVIKTLSYIDDKITMLARTFGIKEFEHEEVSYEQSLMNGPQHQNSIPTQDDIDKLFGD